jgi:ATP-dependent DNA helicase RecG
MLYRMDLVEHIGSGLKRIRETMVEYGLEEPMIEADDHWFTVTFKRKTTLKGLEKSREKGQGKRTRTKDAVLQYLTETPTLTIADLAAILNIGERRVRRHITGLKASGLLKRIGPDKGGHWEVVPKS